VSSLIHSEHIESLKILPKQQLRYTARVRAARMISNSTANKNMSSLRSPHRVKFSKFNYLCTFARVLLGKQPKRCIMIRFILVQVVFLPLVYFRLTNIPRIVKGRRGYQSGMFHTTMMKRCRELLETSDYLIPTASGPASRRSAQIGSTPRSEIPIKLR